MIIRDLESKEIILVEIVDNASPLYTFSCFVPKEIATPLTDMVKFIHLNLGVLSSTLTLVTYVELPSPLPHTSSKFSVAMVSSIAHLKISISS